MEFKISVVATVRDDETGVKRLLSDLKKQTKKADEVIVIRSENYGNCSRGRGRNIGIKMARNELIAVTDVGCRPERKWLEKIDGQMAKIATKVGKVGRSEGVESQAIVVAGWYRAMAKTEWQKAFLHYLVPKIRPVNYLPASRSIAFTKKAWELVGGYPEEPVSGGEDLKFADNLYKNPEVNIIFAPDALVDWPVPLTLTAFAKDVVKHTRGNFEVGYWPHIVRNLSVVERWAIMAVFPWMIAIYFGLEIKRRIKIITNIKIIIIMITVRLVADAAVVYGTVIGIIDEWVIKKLRLLVSDG